MSEDPCDLRVHVDELVAHHGDLAVSLVDALIDPVLVGLTDDVVDEVADVAPLEPEAFLRDRQRLHHDVVLASIGEDVLDGQALVVGNAYGLDLVALEAGLRTGYDIPQVHVGDGLQCGDVPLALVGEEAVDLYMKYG